MIVSIDEFLLLVQSWKNSSAHVRLVFIVGREGADNPLSTTLIAHLTGKVISFSRSDSNIVFAVGEDGRISFGFKEAVLEFATSVDSTAHALGEILSESGEIEEMVALRLPSGLRIAFITFK